MKIAVCIKLVPATTADIRVAPDGRTLALDGIEMGISTYDEYALEAALRLREAVPGTTIHALSAGGDEALRCLRQAYALGVDGALQIAGELDVMMAAKAAAAALKSLAPDVVLCGRQALDDDQWCFPGALAERLNWAHVTAASTLELVPDGKSLRCRRRGEGGEETLEVALPAVVSCDRGPHEPRVATLKARLASKKRQPDIATPGSLGLMPADVLPMLEVVRYEPPPQRTPGRIIGGTAHEAARELTRLLREEARVI
jgi:electron transfer flavoprotein beta subunit